MFLDERSRVFYPEWETTAREAVSGIWLLAGQDPNDRALMALVGELATRSNEFRTWWGGHTVRIHASGSKRTNHPVVGELTCPAIANPLPSIDQYGTVLMASGIWNVRELTIMATFAENYDFTGKTIRPVTTHAMSGLGTTEKDYARTCPGGGPRRRSGRAGEEVRDAGPDIESWLRRVGLLTS